MIASTQTNHPLVGNGKPDAAATASVDLATAKLKSAGLRVTKPRIAILAALTQRSQPTSIEQLHDDVGTENCDLVTVYRCMAAFEQIGLVRRAFFHNGTALYEMSLGRPNRYHVVCKETDQVVELDEETAEQLRQAVNAVEDKLRARGYTDVAHLVEFFGVAPRAGRTAVATVPAVR